MISNDERTYYAGAALLKTFRKDEKIAKFASITEASYLFPCQKLSKNADLSIYLSLQSNQIGFFFVDNSYEEIFQNFVLQQKLTLFRIPCILF